MLEARIEAAEPLAVRGAGSSRLRLAAMLAKAIVSLALVGYLFSRYAPGPERLASIDLAWCALALVPLFGTLLPTAERWRLILRRLGADPAWSRMFPVFYASVFFAQVLPSIGGDVVRVLYCRTLGAPMRALVVSILLDRGMALCAICVLTLVALPQLSTWDRSGSVVLSAGVFAGGALCVAYLGAAIVRVFRRSALWARLPGSLRRLADDVAWTLTSRTGVLALLPLSIAVHLLSILSMFLIARALGIELGFLEMLALGPIILLAQVVPISIGGWGVREAAAVFLLTMAGVDAASALAMSVAFGLAVAVMAFPGVVFWLLLRE